MEETLKMHAFLKIQQSFIQKLTLQMTNFHIDNAEARLPFLYPPFGDERRH